MIILPRKHPILGNRIRISVEPLILLQAVLFGASVTIAMDDVFEVQDEIVRKVMVALVGKLETASLERAKRKHRKPEFL